MLKLYYFAMRNLHLPCINSLSHRSLPALLFRVDARVLVKHGCPPRTEVWLHPIMGPDIWRYRSSLCPVVLRMR